jgi:hypothetical protein
LGFILKLMAEIRSLLDTRSRPVRDPLIHPCQVKLEYSRLQGPPPLHEIPAARTASVRYAWNYLCDDTPWRNSAQLEGTRLLEIHSKSEGNSMVESQLIQTGGIEILVSGESAAATSTPPWRG